MKKNLEEQAKLRQEKYEKRRGAYLIELATELQKVQQPKENQTLATAQA